MSLARWKIMAGFLGLSVGGLAMCCAQTSPVAPPKGPSLELPEPGALKLDLPPAVKPADPARQLEANGDREIEIVLPVITSPTPIDLIAVKAEEKKPEEKKPEVKKGEPKKPDEKKPDLPGLPSIGDLSPVSPAPITPVSPAPLSPVPPTVSPAPAPAPAPIKSEPIKPEPALAPSPLPAPMPLKQDTPPAGIKTSTTFEVPAAPMVIAEPARTPAPSKPEAPIPAPPRTIKEVKPAEAKKPEPAQLKMLLRMGSGTPRFEIRSTASEELLFKVYGEKIEMQSNPEGKGSPLAGVTATGKVRFTGPGVEGTCDSLTLMSGTGEVLMKGNVQLKTKTGRTWSELTAEKMMYQIGLSGLKAPASATKAPTEGPITPTVYRE